MEIKFKLDKEVKLPKYQTEKAVGFDVTAHKILKVFKGDKEVTGEKLERIRRGFEERGYIKLRSLERILFGTGLYPYLSDNIELQVRSRSGLSLKKGLIAINQPGTIDSDYRGEIGIILYNSTPFLNEIKKGQRIAQLVPKEVIRPKITKISEDNYNNINSERGDKGFGSTGE